MSEPSSGILEKHLPGRRWELQRPAAGWRKSCFVAISGDDKYFLKFDVPVELLKRLGEIRVAPKVLFSGECDGTPYVIQEFITGVQPQGRAWMRRHVDDLVAIIKTYHEDGQLRAELAKTCPTNLKQHLSRDLRWLSRRFRHYRAAYLQTPAIQRGYERLLSTSSALSSERLVPIHNDPSPTNILLADGNFIFVDWDEITLSDPMRDIGLLLWWNFPPDQWRGFFEEYGMELTGPRLAKIYWFAARASLDIALWHAEHGVDGQGFVTDFLAALNGQPNPQGY